MPSVGGATAATRGSDRHRSPGVTGLVWESLRQTCEIATLMSDGGSLARRSILIAQASWATKVATTVALVAFAAGCNSEAETSEPETFTVKGSVHLANGGGTAVDHRCFTHPGWRTSARARTW